MPWDHPEPFQLELQPQAADIDALGHVNNVRYVEWLERCAWQHSASLGIRLDDYLRLDRAMAVLRHEIDYLLSARLGDALVMGTWILDGDGRLQMTRGFQLLRVSDGKTLLRARTQFVCIEPSSGRPRRMPELFRAGYGRALSAVRDVNWASGR